MAVSAFAYRARLTALIERVDKTRPGADPEFIAHWARYLCVLSSGLIEVSVQESFAEYARRRSAPRVHSYVLKQLEWAQNLKMRRILEIAGAFDQAWAEELRKQTDGDLKDAIDSIVNNRNLIAHGAQISLSFYQLQDYYSRTLKVLDLVEARCNA